MCLYVHKFQKHVFKSVNILSERLKEMKEQKKNNGGVLIAEATYNSQNAQFGLVRKVHLEKFEACLVNIRGLKL